ncbi:AAA family ATPase [Ancylobacter lacus]|uniref:AAA family ATPase n=1 Tax=Ancylobacter lacus TaxID=2579970 RepID=UPI001BCF0CD0|nr:AAA family ATPase [Ancylobacter lacus]MBS7538855.1 AAA family ATPase [Ancylobacter lacus]
MMRLRRLDLTRYGKFTDHRLDFGPCPEGEPDLHIVYGLNEAGKSTALAGYLDLLFGIEERSRYNFLHPYGTMEVGATLEAGEEARELRRVKQRTGSLRDAAGQPMNEGWLAAALAGLSRDSYRMMFSLDDQTLEEGGDAILESRGDLGELLFSASAGLAGLGRRLEEIDTEAESIFRKRASSTAIAALKRRLAELKTQREAIDVQASAHAALTATLAKAGQAYDEAAGQRASARARLEDVGRVLRALPLARELHRIAADLAGLDGLPRPPAHWAAELPRLMDADARQQTQLAGLDGRLDRLGEEIDAIVLDTAVLALGERIERLGEATARFRGAEDDLPKRRASLAALQGGIDALLNALGQPGEPEPTRLVLPAATVGTLRDLIEQRSGIATARDAAAAEAEAAAAAVEAAQDELARLGDPPPDDAGRSATLRALVGRLRQGDLAARLHLAERELPQSRRRLDQALAVLAPWVGDPAALRAVEMPELTRIEHWRGTLATLEGRRTTHQNRLRELVTQQREQEAQIAALEASAGAIDDVRATALRAERDAAWRLHRARLDLASAEAFETRMREADHVADQRLARADDVAGLRSLAAARALTRAQHERENELLAEAEVALRALDGQIRRSLPFALPAEDDTAQALGRLERWSRLREAALAACDIWQAAKATAEAAHAEGERERTQFAALLATPEGSAAALPLPVLVERAEAALAQAGELRQARETAERRLREQERDLATRRRAATAAAAALEDWQARWNAALASTWFAGRGTDTGAVRAVLDALGGLAAELPKRADMQHRVDTMEQDRQAFATELGALYDALGMPLDPDAMLPAARALANRLDHARQELRRRREREAEHARLRAERAALAADMAVQDSRKAELLAFFGVGDLLEVGQALAACAARDRLEHDHASVAIRIAAEMQADSLEEALRELAGLDPAALTRESAELAGRIEDLDERVKQLFAERTRAADRLDAIGGDDAAARLEAERRTVLLDMEEKALRFLRLKTGGLIAGEALRAYRDRHRSSMMERASDAFRLITRGAYSGLTTRPNGGSETLIGLTAAGASKLASDMSKGTRFQLYLALRLAGYEEFAAARPSVPFVADDIMETFDEPRSEEVFRLFARMARSGQVIYLTHHRHLCDIAQRVAPEARLHALS